MNLVEPRSVRTRKPRGQGPTRRGEILAAAKHLFLEEGVEHVTMRRIAMAVGVSATALYVYFADKDAILQAIAAECFNKLIAAHEASHRPGNGPIANLRAGLQTYVAFGRAHPDEYRLVFLRSSRRGGMDPCKDVPEADIGFGLLVASIDAVMAAGLCPPRPAMLVAEAIWACLHGLVTLLIQHPDAVESDSAALIDQVVDMAIAGMCATL